MVFQTVGGRVQQITGRLLELTTPTAADPNPGQTNADQIEEVKSRLEAQKRVQDETEKMRDISKANLQKIRESEQDEKVAQ